VFRQVVDQPERVLLHAVHDDCFVLQEFGLRGVAADQGLLVFYAVSQALSLEGWQQSGEQVR
jgi:hypothetical protein